ncbi:hypothetical protein SAMN04487943_11084 [Gracilibacillus orientalis]|uniref:DUF4352 domain-containing protein n=1 Tax=Gracilibacillus orientalis TaxID=334253 RepID=A0A1I4P566_9BACI|nr:hypothetical protein [Gracilibacillus orientalis]SFM22928.1 hypothetical protein SAMN04487943_11084 [Gracilibacillus orientalis]
MKKYLAIFASLLAVLILAACNSEGSDEDEENEETSVEETTTSEENESEEEETEEIPEEESKKDDSESAGSDIEAVKEKALERYPDDVRIGEELEFERNDIAHDHVNQIVNSFKIVDEIDGVEPKNDHFIIVNMTIENLIDDFAYGLDFLKPVGYDDSTSTFQRESGELEEEFVDEGDGITTGNIIIDIEDSDYYRIKVNGGYIILFRDEATEE